MKRIIFYLSVIYSLLYILSVDSLGIDGALFGGAILFVLIIFNGSVLTIEDIKKYSGHNALCEHFGWDPDEE